VAVRKKPRITAPQTEKINARKAVETPEGTIERITAIREGNEYYFQEYTNKRVKGKPTRPELIQSNKPYIRWSVKLGGSVSGVPAIHKNRLYLSCYDYQLLALDAQTGKTIFQAKTWSQAIGAPVLYNDTVIIGQRNGNITSYNLQTGKRKWNHRIAVNVSRETLDISIAAITLHEEYLYLSKHWGNLYILNAEKGYLLQTPGIPYESRINLPAITFADSVLFCNVAGELHCHHISGKPHHWSHTIEAGYPLTMKYASDKIFIATTEKQFFAMDAKTRKVLWTIATNGHAYNAMAFNNGTIYLAAGNLYAIDAQEGRIVWQFPGHGEDGFQRGSPIVENDYVYAVEEHGLLHKIARNSGESLQQYEIQGIVKNGLAKQGELVYVSTINKEIIAVDINK